MGFVHGKEWIKPKGRSVKSLHPNNVKVEHELFHRHKLIRATNVRGQSVGLFTLQEWKPNAIEVFLDVVIMVGLVEGWVRA